jgi:hypothetical protein
VEAVDPSAPLPNSAPVPIKGQNLFASATESCFFRRPAFSPDGAILVTPMGLFKNSLANISADGAEPPPSYCTHVFSRASFLQGNAAGGSSVMPIYSLTGKEEPSVAVRFNPRLFTMMATPAGAADSTVLRGKYRMVFAVVTTSSVFIYDTQHQHPIVTVSGIHYATINDAAWSADGGLLTVCSSDGYVTFIKFPVGELGDLLPDDQVPTCVKACHPCVYNWTRPVPVTRTAATSAAEDDSGAATASSANKMETEDEAPAAPVPATVFDSLTKSTETDAPAASPAPVEAME